MSTADAPATTSTSLPSSPSPEPVVWICAHVEEMRETTAYISIPRETWDTLTVQERDDLVDDFGAQTMNDAGGYGVGIVDESEVPADEIERNR